MVGIVGIVSNDKFDIDIKKLLSDMCLAIKHRDIHKTEYYINDGIGIGRVHLGKFNPESQPLFNEDKTLCIIMDGEIYDYQNKKELLISKGHKFIIDNDPEFILHLYEEYGNDFVHQLNGNFSFAIWDIRSKKLLLVNDRYGLRPIYYTKDNGYLLFGSEIKAIIRDNNFKRIVDDRSVADFFSLGFITGDRTFLKGIELLPYGSILTYQDGKISIEQYWDYELNEKYEGYSEKWYLEQLSKVTAKAIDRRMKGNVGVLLSGGLDSRTILGFISKTYNKRINTFTYGKTDCNDFKYAQMIAETLGTTHHYFRLKPEDMAIYAENVVYLTEGMLNVLEANFLLSDILEKISESTDIFLHGYIGDTTTGNRFTGLNDVLINFKDNFKIMTDVCNYLPSNFLSNIFSENYFPRIEKELNSMKDYIVEIGNKIENPIDRLMYYLLREKNRRIILVGFSVSRNIIEDRTPFVDNDYIDLILRIPNKYKTEQKLYKKMILSQFPELKEIPRQSTGLPLYKSTFEIKSRIAINMMAQKIFGTAVFSEENKDIVSYSSWIRDNKKLREYILSILLDKRTLERPYFNQTYIKEIIDSHMRGEKDHSSLIGLLLTFELWNRQFIDNNVIDNNVISGDGNGRSE